MARRRTYTPLNVFLNGRLIGLLRRQSSGAIDFEYASDWLTWQNTFAVSLSLPLREERYIGEAVLNVLDNLLPDSASIRKRVAERVGADGTDAYSLLAALGHDCVGALQFMPEGVDPGPVGAVDGKPIPDDEIATMLRNLANAPLGMGRDRGFRLSIAGAQEKTALLRLDGRWLKPAGSTATTHILKPQIGRLPNGIDLSNSVENEYFCLKLLAAFGVPTAKAEIAEFGDLKTLVVERFDRRWTGDKRLLRLPQEDICQALSRPSAQKYEADGGPGMRDIIEVLKGSDAPNEDISVFMRACILFWMIGGTDGHAKNFSIALGRGAGFRLTPLYDVLTAQPSVDAKQLARKSLELAMSVGRKRHYRVDAIMPRHFFETASAARVGAPLMHRIIDDIVGDAERRFDSVVDALPTNFPDALVTSVKTAMASRTRFLEEARRSNEILP